MKAKEKPPDTKPSPPSSPNPQPGARSPAAPGPSTVPSGRPPASAHPPAGVSQRRLHGAAMVRDGLIPSLMQLAANPSGEIDGPAFRAYRDAMVREAGPRDVLEQTLIEQVTLAHVASARLLARGGLADTAEEAALLSAAAAKLMGESRRCVIALKDFHSPPQPANITISANQQVTVAERSQAGAEAAEKYAPPIELRGNDNGPARNRLRDLLGESPGRTAKRETTPSLV